MSSLQSTKFAVLACPRCGGGLDRRGSRETCGRCGVVGEVVEDLPCFADVDYYWGEIDRESMRRANETALLEGWRRAVEATVPAALSDYIVSPRRADFRFLWDLPADSTILDVGAGWGGIAHCLSEDFERVVAVEGVYERARFIKTRAEQERPERIEVIQGDFLALPLAAGQFDAVVVNGVLEWVGLASREGSPREVQLGFLRRIHDLLKPGGLLCVGIENRIGLDMWLGACDHSGLPYTSLMPRRIADSWCRWKGRGYRSDLNQGYRTYTYSLAGYRKLFRESGFASMESYDAWNGYNCPDILIPLDEGAEPLLHFLSKMDYQERRFGGLRRRLREFSARAGLWKRLADQYIMLLRKS